MSKSEHIRPQAAELAFRLRRKLLVGGDGVEVGEFLSKPVEHWLEA